MTEGNARRAKFFLIGSTYMSCFCSDDKLCQKGVDKNKKEI